jgi:hypothetical protein
MSELYQPRDRRFSAKLVQTFLDRWCHVVSVTDSYSRIIGFLGRSRYFFFQVAPQFYTRGWVDPVPDTLHLRKSGSAGNRTRTSEYVARNSDHYTTEAVEHKYYCPNFPWQSVFKYCKVRVILIKLLYITPPPPPQSNLLFHIWSIRNAYGMYVNSTSPTDGNVVHMVPHFTALAPCQDAVDSAFCLNIFISLYCICKMAQ